MQNATGWSDLWPPEHGRVSYNDAMGKTWRLCSSQGTRIYEHSQILKACRWQWYPAHISALPHHSHVCCPTRSPSFPGLVHWHMAIPCCLTSRSTYGFPQKTRPVTSTCKKELFPTTQQKNQSRAAIHSGSPKSTFSEYIVFLREATHCSQLAASRRSTNEVQIRYSRPQENHVLTDSELVQTHLKSKERHKPDLQRDHCPLDPATEQIGTVLWHHGGERREQS